MKDELYDYLYKTLGSYDKADRKMREIRELEEKVEVEYETKIL